MISIDLVSYPFLWILCHMNSDVNHGVRKLSGRNWRRNTWKSLRINRNFSFDCKQFSMNEACNANSGFHGNEFLPFFETADQAWKEQYERENSGELLQEKEMATEP